MPSFSNRFKRLLDFADEPLPGDRVRIGHRASHAPWRGKIGVVKRVGLYHVEVDGEIRDITPGSLEIVQND